MRISLPLILLALAFPCLAANEAPPAEESRPTVLVLPFKLLGNEAGQAWIGQALQQDLQAELARKPFFRVVAPTTRPAPREPVQGNAIRPGMVTIPDHTDAALDIARAHRADLVVFGAYQVVEKDLRITGQVFDVRSGQSLGGLKATGNLNQLLDLEDVLGEQVTEVLVADTRIAAARQRDAEAVANQTQPAQGARAEVDQPKVATPDPEAELPPLPDAGAPVTAPSWYRGDDQYVDSSYYVPSYPSYTYPWAYSSYSYDPYYYGSGYYPWGSMSFGYYTGYYSPWCATGYYPRWYRHSFPYAHRAGPGYWDFRDDRRHDFDHYRHGRHADDRFAHRGPGFREDDRYAGRPGGGPGRPGDGPRRPGDGRADGPRPPYRPDAINRPGITPPRESVVRAGTNANRPLPPVRSTVQRPAAAALRTPNSAAAPSGTPQRRVTSTAARPNVGDRPGRAPVDIRWPSPSSSARADSASPSGRVTTVRPTTPSRETAGPRVIDRSPSRSTAIPDPQPRRAEVTARPTERPVDRSSVEPRRAQVPSSVRPEPAPRTVTPRSESPSYRSAPEPRRAPVAPPSYSPPSRSSAPTPAPSRSMSAPPPSRSMASPSYSPPSRSMSSPAPSRSMAAPSPSPAPSRSMAAPSPAPRSAPMGGGGGGGGGGGRRR